jgi:hypothetical protein
LEPDTLISSSSNESDDELIGALHKRGSGIAPEGTGIRFAGPDGAMSEPFAAALPQHKALILAVWKTLRRSQAEPAWTTVCDWVSDGKPGPVPPAVTAPGKTIHLPHGLKDWSPQYEEQLRMALRVRALLRILDDGPMAIGSEGSMPRSGESIYRPLVEHVPAQPGGEVFVTFAEIEGLIEREPAVSTRVQPSYWSGGKGSVTALRALRAAGRLEVDAGVRFMRGQG